MKIVQKTFSGYRFNLPKNFRLVAVKVTGTERIEKELKDEFFGVRYFMQLKAHHVFKDVFES